MITKNNTKINNTTKNTLISNSYKDCEDINFLFQDYKKSSYNFLFYVYKCLNMYKYIKICKGGLEQWKK